MEADPELDAEDYTLLYVCREAPTQTSKDVLDAQRTLRLESG